MNSQDIDQRFSELAQLFGGYLNQDVSDYGSADAAVDAFATDAPKRREPAARELQVLLNAYRDGALPGVLDDLDSAYYCEAEGLTARSWLERVLARFEAAL